MVLFLLTLKYVGIILLIIAVIIGLLYIINKNEFWGVLILIILAILVISLGLAKNELYKQHSQLTTHVQNTGRIL